MAKSITLATGQSFASIKVAKVHFDTLLKNQELEVDFPSADFEDLSALYLAYCKKTDWPVTSRPVAFFPTYDRRPGASSLCFGVRFEDNNEIRFSLPRVLSSAAV